MDNDEKIGIKHSRFFTALGKWLVIFCIFLISLLLLAHFGLRYGIHIADIGENIRNHWVIWLCIRLVIYVISAFFIYRIFQYSPPENHSHYYKMGRAAIIGVVVVELINIVQLVRE